MPITDSPLMPITENPVMPITDGPEMAITDSPVLPSCITHHWAIGTVLAGPGLASRGEREGAHASDSRDHACAHHRRPAPCLELLAGAIGTVFAWNRRRPPHLIPPAENLPCLWNVLNVLLKPAVRGTACRAIGTVFAGPGLRPHRFALGNAMHASPWAMPSHTYVLASVVIPCIL
jgi:hypothetical protein